jgi:hypothetical protein
MLWTRWLWQYPPQGLPDLTAQTNRPNPSVGSMMATPERSVAYGSYWES